MITKERRVELREMNDVHAVTPEGMFRIKTPEFIELLNDVDRAEGESEGYRQAQLVLSADVVTKGAEIIRLRKALEQIARPAPNEKQTSYTNILKGIARQALEFKS